LNYFSKIKKEVNPKATKSKMSYASILKALDVLVEYPDLQEYIKDFNGSGGFMFTRENDQRRINCAARLEELLDADGNHSGGSWGSLMRSIQAVLTGRATREQVLEKMAEEEEHMNRMRAKNAELRKARFHAEVAQYVAAEAEAEEAPDVIGGDAVKIDCQFINIIKEFE
jgi:hypothetical protein